MYYYKIFGIPFKSDLKLAGLKENKDKNFDFEIQKTDALPKSEEFKWYLKIPYKDDISHTFAELGKNDSSYIIRFIDYLDFLISKDLKKIWFSKKNDIDINTLQHLLIDQVIPRIISDDNSIVIHASAIKYKNKVIIFIGESGSGKSTSALALSNQSKNINLLCDDSILLKKNNKELLVLPSYLAVKVWPDSAKKLQNNKFEPEKVSAINNKLVFYKKNQQFDLENKNLSVVYNLNPLGNKEISIVKMASKKAFEEMTKGVFRLDVYNKNQLRKEFNFISQLTGNIQFFDIFYKKDFNLISNFSSEIIKHLEANY